MNWKEHKHRHINDHCNVNNKSDKIDSQKQLTQIKLINAPFKKNNILHIPV